MATLKELFLPHYSIYNHHIEEIPRKSESLREDNRYLKLQELISQMPKVHEEKTVESQKQDLTSENPDVTVPILTVNKEQRLNNLKTYTNNKQLFNTVFNHFLKQGFTKEQVAGIMGNLFSESNLNYRAFNKDEKASGIKGYGRGLAQWSNERVDKFKEIIGKTIEDSSLEDQLTFITYEMNNRPEFLKALKAAKSAEEASEIVYRGYENGSSSRMASPENMQKVYEVAWANLGYRPYNYEEENKARQKKSNDALKLYNNGKS